MEKLELRCRRCGAELDPEDDLVPGVNKLHCSNCGELNPGPDELPPLRKGAIKLTPPQKRVIREAPKSGVPVAAKALAGMAALIFVISALYGWSAFSKFQTEMARLPSPVSPFYNPSYAISQVDKIHGEYTRAMGAVFMGWIFAAFLGVIAGVVAYASRQKVKHMSRHMSGMRDRIISSPERLFLGTPFRTSMLGRCF